MTPLAQEIVRQLVLPKKQRGFNDSCDLLARLRNEFHTFDVTDVLPEMRALGLAFLSDAMPSIEWSFLPAGQTWIEWSENGSRIGFLLYVRGRNAGVILVRPNGALFLGEMALEHQLERCARDPREMLFSYQAEAGEPLAKAIFMMLWAALCLINTPQVVNRRVHQPHRGLQRALVARLGVQGSFPLQAWTEIVLTPLRPVDATGEPAVEGGLTGRVCLHWVRSHKRRITGVWRLVEGFWRGDGSLGIKRSRYKVAA